MTCARACILLIQLFVLLFVTASRAQDTAIANFERRLEDTPGDSTKAMTLLKAAWEYKYTHPKLSHQFIDEAITIAQLRSDDKRLATGYYYKAVIYYLASRYDSAMYWSGLAKPLYETQNNDEGMAWVYNIRGLVGERVGDYDHAIEDYQHSLEYAGKTQDLYGQSEPLHNIGLIYNKTGDYKRALEYFLRALSLREQLKDTTLIARSFQTIALTYSNLGDTAKCIDFHRRSIPLFKQKENWNDLASAYSSLGHIYTATRKFDLSRKLLDEAFKLNAEIGNKEGTAKTLIYISELRLAGGDLLGAERYATRAALLADSLHILPELKLAYDGLSAAQAALGKYREAFETERKLKVISESLMNSEKVQNLSSLEVRYQLREKEQQITLQETQLSQQTTLIKYNFIVTMALLLLLLLGLVFFLYIRSQYRRRQDQLGQQHALMMQQTYLKATLQSQEAERKRVALDLHDGMGQLLSSLRLTVSGIEKGMTPDQRLGIVSKAESILNEMHREIRSIAFNLMPQTLIQYGLVPALREMALRINAVSTTLVSVNSFGLPERLLEVQEISVYRILQEWTNNVLKYAQATKIEIQLVHHENEITITVEDNGKGFDIETLRNSKGHGWRNIQSRLNLLRGTLDVDSQLDRDGTSFIIQFPVNSDKLREFWFDGPASIPGSAGS